MIRCKNSRLLLDRSATPTKETDHHAVRHGGLFPCWPPDNLSIKIRVPLSYRFRINLW